MSTRRLLALACLATLAPTAASQSYSTISFESFDYPVGTGMHNATGGTGWSSSWWSGDPPSFSPVDHAITVAPSLDGVGNAANVQVVILNGETGSYRFPATQGFENLLDYQTDANGIFGKDDTTLWFSFHTRRAPGSDAQYGGISFNHQFVAEHLFLGSPNSWNLWGVHDDPFDSSGVGNIVTTVPNSNIDQAAHLVYRIDFFAGQERLRLWVDPAVPHPDTPADMDVMIHDFRFNEIGFKAGNELTNQGWWFDGILLETPNTGVGTPYCFGNGGAGVDCPCGNLSTNDGGCTNGTGQGAVLSAIGSAGVSNDTLTLFATDLIPNQPGLFFQGDNAVNLGSGVIFGDGLRCAGGNVVRLQVVVSDAAGQSQSSIPLAAAGGVSSGDVKRYQAWYRDPILSPCGQLFNLSNGLEIVWAP